MKLNHIGRCTLSVALAMGGVGLSAQLTACERETTTSKETSTKVVETPEGPKKVTEKTQTTTTTEKKSNP